MTSWKISVARVLLAEANDSSGNAIAINANRLDDADLIAGVVVHQDSATGQKPGQVDRLRAMVQDLVAEPAFDRVFRAEGQLDSARVGVDNQGAMPVGLQAEGPGRRLLPKVFKLPDLLRRWLVGSASVSSSFAGFVVGGGAAFKRPIFSRAWRSSWISLQTSSGSFPSSRMIEDRERSPSSIASLFAWRSFSGSTHVQRRPVNEWARYRSIDVCRERVPVREEEFPVQKCHFEPAVEHDVQEVLDDEVLDGLPVFPLLEDCRPDARIVDALQVIREDVVRDAQARRYSPEDSLNKGRVSGRSMASAPLVDLCAVLDVMPGSGLGFDRWFVREVLLAVFTFDNCPSAFQGAAVLASFNEAHRRCSHSSRDQVRRSRIR